MAITHSYRDAERVFHPGAKVKSWSAAAATVHADIHPAVYKIFVACWAALFAVFAATFAESRYTMYLITVAVLNGAMFFGLPYVMSRVAPPSTRVGEVSFAEFMRGKVETLTGAVSSWEALAQVITVPLALTLGALAISFIVHIEADHIHMLYIAQSGPFPR